MVADFLVEPRRSSILRRFPGFARADVEDALLFAYEQSLHGKCRERNEFSIRAWLRQVMRRELVHQAERRAQVGLAGREEVDFDLIADAELRGDRGEDGVQRAPDQARSAAGDGCGSGVDAVALDGEAV